ncbi:MAG TPA: hypothetical protein VJ720_01970, partial [Chitinophaga sp.]|nr:hypothetical protein [Chitinophaga sp.]
MLQIFPRGMRHMSGDIYYLVTIDTSSVMALVPFERDTIHYTSPVVRPVRKGSPLLTVHGNIMYDFYYQSAVDTPYQQKDVYQHTVQVYMDVMVRDRYPLRINFSTTQGNAALFRNITGVNLQYTNRDFRNMLLEKLQEWDENRLKQRSGLNAYRTKLDGKAMEVYKLRSWLNSSAQIQKLVEERERKLYGNSPSITGIKDSLTDISALDVNTLLRWKGNWAGTKTPSAADSVTGNFEDLYKAKEKQLDSLQKEWNIMDASYREQQAAFGSEGSELMEKIARSRNNRELAKTLEASNLPDTVLPEGYKTLLAIRSFGIGRTLVNYSELTAKDISIQGVQAEYNPSYYLAIATGGVDYRFRNYVVNSNRTGQYLSLFRAGIGMKEGNNLIFTYYFGKKQVFNQNTADSTKQPDYRLMGIALEGRMQLGTHTFISGEVARSSMPYYMQDSQTGSKFSSIFKLSDHRNEAYAVKAESFIPETGTRLSGVYKVMGAGFQSFSLYTTGSSQTAWSVRVDQPFFKQQLMVTAGIRKNDYSSQYQQASYSTNSVFKSIQATLRMKHWPVITVGYYPSSQLTKLSEGHYMENQFYTLVGSLSHSYRYKGMMMNSMLSYTQFYNHQADTGFVYFNTKNLLASHIVFLDAFTLQGMASAAINNEYALYGIDGNVQYKIYSWLIAGGGLKYSLQTVHNIRQLGYSANTRIDIPRLGQIELLAEKGF